MDLAQNLSALKKIFKDGSRKRTTVNKTYLKNLEKAAQGDLNLQATNFKRVIWVK